LSSLAVIFRHLFRIRRKQPSMFKVLLSIVKPIGKALLSLFVAKATEVAVEAAPEAIKVVKDGLKKKAPK
jgi:hypothetical protein